VKGVEVGIHKEGSEGGSHAVEGHIARHTIVGTYPSTRNEEDTLEE